VNDPYDTKLC